MTDRDLMQQALEALENLQGLCTDAEDGCLEAITIWTPEIIDALRERLAQPAQQQHISYVCPQCFWSLDEQPAQQEQKPVAWMDADGDLYKEEPEPKWCPPHTPLYTSPPQRKPLTDEQIDRLWSQSLADTKGETYLPLREFARAIEAAHGIKENT